MGWKRLKEHFKVQHIVHVERGEIHIGSLFCPQMIRVDKTGRAANVAGFSLSSPDFLRYLDEMNAEPERTASLIAEADRFSKSVPVFTWDGTTIVERHCEEPGFPNVTHCGELMWDGQYFSNREEAVRMAIQNARESLQLAQDRVSEKAGELAAAQQRLADREALLATLLADHQGGKTDQASTAMGRVTVTDAAR